MIFPTKKYIANQNIQVNCCFINSLCYMLSLDFGGRIHVDTFIMTTPPGRHLYLNARMASPSLKRIESIALNIFQTSHGLF